MVDRQMFNDRSFKCVFDSNSLQYDVKFAWPPLKSASPHHVLEIQFSRIKLKIN